MKLKKILKRHLNTDYVGIGVDLHGQPPDFYQVSEILEMKELLNRQVILISATLLKSATCLHEVQVVVYLLDD